MADEEKIPVDYSSDYSGKQGNFPSLYVLPDDGFRLISMKEENKKANLTRETYQTKTWKTYLHNFYIYIIGFLSGLLCNYIATWISDKFAFWK